MGHDAGAWRDSHASLVKGAGEFHSGCTEYRGTLIGMNGPGLNENLILIYLATRLMDSDI